MSYAGALVAELAKRIHDERVLAAVAAVPRELFVLPADRGRAWENVALPIESGQTISQPLVVARMLELLELTPTDRVLDVGTGSGYHAALLAQLVAEVFTIERLPELSRRAERTLAGAGIGNVTCAVGDGARGLEAEAPFDAINVAAASPRGVPPELEHQLALGGRLIVPVGGRHQYLMRSVRTEAGWRRTTLDPVRFVPLLAD